MALGISSAIKIGDGGGSEVFTELINVTSLSYDGKVWDTAEITALNAAGNRSRKHVSTLYSAGTATFTISPFVSGNTQHALLKSKNESGDTWNFQVLPNGGGTYEFAAIVTQMKPVTTVDGVFGYDVTVQGTGEVAIS